MSQKSLPATGPLVAHHHGGSGIAAGMFFSFLMLSSVLPTSLKAAIFYVDPDWAGSATGAAASPWASFSSSAWTTINNTLLNDDVTVYVAALKSDGTQQSRAWFLELQRSVANSHRLTIDGYSYWNTNKLAPSWQANGQNISVAYTNSQVFKLTGDGWDALGWTRASTYKKQDNVTLRGFECAGGARVGFAGDHVILEYLSVHDTTVDPAVRILYTFNDSGVTNASQQLFPRCTDMTIRHCRIENVAGEAIYVGSVNPDLPPDIQQQIGNQHSNITIEDVFIRNPGTGSGQGDGIDCKPGTLNLTVRDCDISGVKGVGGILCPLTMVNTNQNILIERCFVHDSAATGEERIGIRATGAAYPYYGIVGVTIRNCIVARHNRGLEVSGYDGVMTNAWIYNNTVYGCASQGLIVASVFQAEIRNNLVWNNNALNDQVILYPKSGAQLSSDYNAIYPWLNYASEGTNSVALSATDASTLVIDVNRNNFTPTSTSKVRGRGLALANFNNDFLRTIRPSIGWDIGAIQAAGRPNPPTNLRVLTN